ncbi:MAG: hypothetical protein JNK63_07620 [Chthonomonas sp.]|nr:hypothetical protein [Chthonomonas sp.]
MPDIAAIMHQLPPDLYRPAPVAIQQIQQDGIRIEYRYQQANLESRTARFWGGIRAYYGSTVLECDELFVDYSNHLGRAQGKVIVTDPDGTLVGDNLEFDWVKQTGTAENATMQVGGVSLTVKRVEVEPGKWTAHQVRGTASKLETPDLAFEAERLVIRPGQRGTASKPSVTVFGHKLGTIPNYGFSLGPKSTGIRLPMPSYKPGGGARITWGYSSDLDSRTSLGGKIRVFQEQPARIQMELTRVVGPLLDIQTHRPRSDLGERFAEGWFDSSVVRTPEEEFKILSQNSQVVGLGSHYGVSSRARYSEGVRLSKPIDAVFEAKGNLEGVAGLIQFRLQRVDVSSTMDSVNRGIATIALRSKEIPLTDKMSLVLGTDASVLAGEHRSYSWARAMGYVLIRPEPHVRIGLGGTYGFDGGRPHFDFDRNKVDRSFHVRGDFDLGNIDLIALFKYDAHRGRWYDTELAISFIAGSIQPFLRYRQFPEEFTIGASLRIDEFVELLQGRKFKSRNRSTDAGSP